MQEPTVQTGKDTADSSNPSAESSTDATDSKTIAKDTPVKETAESTETESAGIKKPAAKKMPKDDADSGKSESGNDGGNSESESESTTEKPTAKNESIKKGTPLMVGGAVAFVIGIIVNLIG